MNSIPSVDLFSSFVNTPLGPMLSLASNQALHLLEFLDRPTLEQQQKFFKQSHYLIKEGSNTIIKQLQKELSSYFMGTLTNFTVPVQLEGTAFQKQVWQALLTIPYGQTRSYSQQAIHIGAPKAFRAVANANGKNRLAIIVPCHRIIAHDGRLGGYSGGINKKQFLLEHEAKIGLSFI